MEHFIPVSNIDKMVRPYLQLWKFGIAHDIKLFQSLFDSPSYSHLFKRPHNATPLALASNKELSPHIVYRISLYLYTAFSENLA
jgi:hypothetical protein